jgi:aspartyl-tRNA(Asn)/glutamyl-tRNA(Gln) amidotransferase subunit B
MENEITEPPDFSGLDPETGEPWSPHKIVRLLGLRAIHDPGEIRRVCVRVVDGHPQQAETYRKGKTKVLGFLVKKVMDETRDGPDPKLTRETLMELLK